MNSRDRAVLLMLFAAFVTLLIEVRYEHRYAVKEAWQAYIPIIYSALAAFASLVALSGKKTQRTIAASVFFLGFAVGGYGLYMHTKFEPAKFQKFFQPDAKIVSGKDADGDPIEVQLNQPLAAPLSMAGLAGIGFVLTSGLFKNGKGTRS